MSHSKDFWWDLVTLWLNAHKRKEKVMSADRRRTRDSRSGSEWQFIMTRVCLSRASVIAVGGSWLSEQTCDWLSSSTQTPSVPACAFISTGLYSSMWFHVYVCKRVSKRPRSVQSVSVWGELGRVCGFTRRPVAQRRLRCFPMGQSVCDGESGVPLQLGQDHQYLPTTHDRKHAGELDHMTLLLC